MPTTYAIPDGRTVMAATLWTGNGTSQAINNAVNGVSFQPDMAWVKDRSAARSHVLIDAVRGTGLTLFPNETTADQSNTDRITSFNSNGFSVGTGLGTNANTETYVGWQWNAGGSTVTNTSGSISAQVRANATAGFSVVTYTGNATAGATVGHGLGVAPSMIITKNRDSTTAWHVFHTSLGATQYIVLNTTAAAVTSSALGWNNTSPTSSVFSLGASNPSNANQDVAYCFAAVAGYSAFGKYTGNGSADGPFVYLGFRPRWIMIKGAGEVSNWNMIDTSRAPYNVVIPHLYANDSAAEAIGSPIYDILSNGFKVRIASGGFNTNGGTYIYAAFAENPFKFSNAR
jgi:hypothetical protein